MKTLAAMMVLTDPTGSYAVIVTGDEKRVPCAASISYEKKKAIEIVSSLDLPRRDRRNAIASICLALGSEPIARTVDFSGEAAGPIAICVAVGLDAFVGGADISTAESWYAEVPNCRSGGRENLTFVSVYDSSRNRFLAALVESRDNLPERYRAVAARLYDMGTAAGGIEIGRDAIVLPEALAAAYAMGWYVLSKARKAAETTVRSVVLMRDGPRPLCVFLCGTADGLSELRWTHGARQAREWSSGSASHPGSDRAELSDRLASMPEEDGPSYVVSGEVGALTAEAFSAGRELLSHGFQYAVVPGDVVRVGANVSGRNGMALAIHVGQDARRYLGAFVENSQSLYDYYLKNVDRVHATDCDLGPGVRGELIIPIPDVLTLAIVTGLVCLLQSETDAN